MKRLLVLLALLAAACGSPSAENAPPTGSGTGTADGPASAQTFLVRGNDRDQFVPATIAAKVGTLDLTLQIDGVPHNLTFSDKALPSIPTLSSGAKKSTTLTFDKPGTYDFECTIHPGMTGKVVVS
ncbi:MAG: cupredoxin domain-containing protein [Actinobacteria bacterium]|nr:cupredoxin domain-containing protein [Actinomycetota bacterium]MCA1722138.1 cupredoxin domain-containing protein [Actinomycetota bacterium]